MKWTSLSFAPATGAFTRYVYNAVTHAVTSSQSIPVQGAVVRDDTGKPAARATGCFVVNQSFTVHDQASPKKAVKVTLPVSGAVGAVAK